MGDDEREEKRAQLNAISERVIGAAIEVHKTMGPGLLEAVYEECLCFELQDRGIPHKRQLCVPILYKGQPISTPYRLDLLVEESVIVEVKAVKAVEPIFEAKLLSYLALTGRRLGLLINFNVVRLISGVNRFVRNF